MVMHQSVLASSCLAITAADGTLVEVPLWGCMSVATALFDESVIKLRFDGSGGAWDVKA